VDHLTGYCASALPDSTVIGCPARGGIFQRVKTMNPCDDEAATDRRMLLMVREAAKLSHDDSKWIGCVIQTVSGALITTANRFPDGVDHQPLGRHEHELGKADWMVHAERKAFFTAAREGIRLQGARLWLNWFPCGLCAQGIIDCGIREVTGLTPNTAHHRFGQSFRNSLEMLTEAGVKVRRFSCDLGPEELVREPG
jgi:dCMP deaminase